MKILFIDTVHNLLKQNLVAKSYICETAYNEDKFSIQKKIYDYEGIIIRSKFKIDKSFVSYAKKLKFVARAGSGLENIDVNYLKKKNIKCFSAGEGNKIAVAEHALGMLLSLFNNFKKAELEIENGLWKREENRGIELSGKTIAVIGYGNTGSAFVNLLKGFNVNILVYDKYLKNYPYQSTMETIYKEADILSLHVPLTIQTKHLIQNKFINKFKKSFFLVNTSRGKCAKTEDLISAINNNKIKGACLDVIEEENNSFEKINTRKSNSIVQNIAKMPNVIVTPHIAGWTHESNIKIAKILLRKITSDFPL